MPAGFPFDVPVVRLLETIELGPSVTFFVGENGSGKSTLLEAIALAAELPTVGSDESRDDTTLASQRALAKHLTLNWTSRSKRGFFLRAEDFFGYAKRLSRLKSEMRQEIADIERKYEGRSEYAKGLAMGPAFASLEAIDGRYGGDLDRHPFADPSRLSRRHDLLLRPRPTRPHRLRGSRARESHTRLPQRS